MTTSKLPSLIGIRSILKVLGKMAYLVASITLNSTRSGNISLGSFLPSVLLWLVIVVVVVGVGVTVVVVVAVVGVGVECNPPMKASRSFLVFDTMFGHRTVNSWNLLTLGICIPPGQSIISKGTGIPVGPVFLLGLLVLAIVAACASRAVVTDMYGYCKNHKKTVKTGQTQTREWKARTRAESF
ncbi:hypothetical protein Tco_1038884 [Tanacetum coccineum]